MISLVRTVFIEIFCEDLRLDVAFEFFRHARADQHGGANRVTGVFGGVGTKEEIDALDLLRHDHAPARWKGIFVSKQVGQQDVIDINQ